MRRYLTRLAATLLSACGGGGDATDAPEGPTFTLTISGTGAGGGRVSTAAGSKPALDCLLAGSAAPSGVCSASYPEGTLVGLIVTPDPGSQFGDWSGDAASCFGGIFCSMTMTQNRNAVAELSPGTAPIQVASAAFYVDPEFGDDGAIVWVFELRNTTPQIVETARVDFTSRDASGTVLTSAFTIAGPIPPGETRAAQGFADLVGNEVSGDIQVGEVRFTTGDPNLGAARIVSSRWRVDPDFGEDGGIAWNVELENTSNVRLESVQVDFSTYDSRGRIVGYQTTPVGPIPAGERRSSQRFTEIRGGEATAKFQIAGIQ